MVCYPGNENVLPLGGGRPGTSAITLSFDESGALTAITSELSGSSRQRATEVSNVVTALTEGASAGKDLRDIYAAPSLEEQVAAAESLKKLQPAEAVPQDVADMLDRSKDEERQARLRLARQLGTATGPPIMVTFKGE